MTERKKRQRYKQRNYPQKKSDKRHDQCCTDLAGSTEEGSNPGWEGRGSEIGFYWKYEQVHRYIHSKNSQGKKL